MQHETNLLRVRAGFLIWTIPTTVTTITVNRSAADKKLLQQRIHASHVTRRIREDASASCIHACRAGKTYAIIKTLEVRENIWRHPQTCEDWKEILTETSNRNLYHVCLLPKFSALKAEPHSKAARFSLPCFIVPSSPFKSFRQKRAKWWCTGQSSKNINANALGESGLCFSFCSTQITTLTAPRAHQRG